MSSDQLSNDLMAYVERVSEDTHLRNFASRAVDEQRTKATRQEAATLARHRAELELEIERAQAKLVWLRVRLAEDPRNAHIGPDIEKTRKRIAKLSKGLEAMRHGAPAGSISQD